MPLPCQLGPAPTGVGRSRATVWIPKIILVAKITISFQPWFRATLKFFKIILFEQGTTA